MNAFSPGPFQSGTGRPRAAPGGSPFLALFLSFLALSLLVCCGKAPAGKSPPSFGIHAQRWPEAEMLFRKDRCWLGGDGAYSVDLERGRVLWLFGDSFIGNGVSRDRKDACVVKNTVAIQRGYDPSASSAAFYWKTVKGKPDAFFPSGKSFWYWPGSGIRVRDRLLIFLMEVEPSGNAFGFALKGWDAVLVANPDDEPERWEVTDLQVPENPFSVIVGSACCISEGGFLCALGADAVDHGAFLVRWKVSDAVQGQLMNIEWWTGAGGWTAQESLTRRPRPLFTKAQMEFTVQYEKALGRFLEIQTDSFPGRCLVFRSSKRLTGPWSEKIRFSCPPVTQEKDLLVYAGKAHPGLAGARLVCTYALNSLDQDRLLRDDSLYYPVFVKGDFTVHRP